MSDDVPTADDGLSPEAAFSLLGNATRIDILQVLAEDPTEPLSFSELRERVGEPDSGKFNYHLQQLTGQFVRRTDEGYALRLAGSLVVGAIVAGAYSRSRALDPIPIDASCRECGGSMELRYAEEIVTLACSDCDHVVTKFGVPPGILEGYDREELPAVIDRWIWTRFGGVVDGFCMNCYGPVTPEVALHDESDDPFLLRFVCDRCGDVVKCAVGTYLRYQPVVAAFHAEHGIDLRTTPSWSLDWLYDDHATVVSEDPVEIVVDVELGDDTLTVVIDEDLDIVETTRS
ncbi:helix-turn-helix domain-containing protein [Halobacteriaceae archaeon GCM10025711]